MRTSRLALLLLVLFVALPAQAQQFESGDVVLSSDPSDWNQCAIVQPFSPFYFYMVSFDLPEIKGYQGSIDVPTQVLILDEVLAGAPPLTIGTSEIGNFIVGAASCFDGSGFVALVSYQAGVFLPVVPPDLTICLGPSDPSSFVPARPGYQTCAGDWVPFTSPSVVVPDYPAECLVLNATQYCGVATESTSWGAVKVAF